MFMVQDKRAEVLNMSKFENERATFTFWFYTCMLVNLNLSEYQCVNHYLVNKNVLGTNLHSTKEYFYFIRSYINALQQIFPSKIFPRSLSIEHYITHTTNVCVQAGQSHKSWKQKQHIKRYHSCSNHLLWPIKLWLLAQVKMKFFLKCIISQYMPQLVPKTSTLLWHHQDCPLFFPHNNQ